MAISFSRPDPSSAAAVAEASFGTSRRGFDQQEVRDFLRMVAAELARLQERERFLERELRSAQVRRADAPDQLDEETLTRLLGEETTRVLQTARESATLTRSKAEEGASRLLRDATDDAQRQREEAELESARRRADATADAEAELSMAKQQGREMVEEARAYRERVLSELTRRRELARQQIEQVLDGRDRLVQAFERARLAAVDVVGELSPMGGPEEYVDLTPTTGPVPVMVPASLLDERAADTTEPPAAEDPPDAEAAADVVEDQPLAEDPPVVSMVVEVGEIGVLRAVPDRPETGIDDDDVTASDVDDLFARLRADTDDTADTDDATEDGEDEPTAEPVEAADDGEGGDDAEETAFARRDAALVPLITASARKLKRALATEQNEVLDMLRRKDPVRTLDALVPWEAEHADRYSDAIAAELLAAAAEGSSAMGTGGGAPVELDIGPGGVLAPIREAIAADLVTPLRERLGRAVDECDGDNDAVAKRIRSLYREWKTQRIDDQLEDLVRMAHGRGAFVALEPGTLVVWAVDPDQPSCADCEDNSLAEPVAAGDAFPTGHLCAPAHAGCRCLLQRVPQ